MGRLHGRLAWRALRWRFLAALCAGAVALAALVIWWRLPAMSRCEQEVRHGAWQRAVAVCLESHQRTGADHDLVWAAKAYLSLGEFERAEELARRVLGGARSGDAHAILGHIALTRDHAGVAQQHAAAARAAHVIARDERGQSSDAVLASQAAWRLGDFAAALDSADEALRLARRLRDPRRQVAAHLARADVLRRLGDFGGAIDTLGDALERATDPCDRAWLHLRNGACHAEIQQSEFALVEFAEARSANRSCGIPEISRAITGFEAWLLRRRDPLGALARLDELEKSVGEDVAILVLRGYLAADRGALDEAEHELVRAANIEPLPSNWRWAITWARAELFAQRGGLLGDSFAEAHFRSAAAMVVALRANARTRAAFLVSRYRGPFDGLIALHARNGRWRDALGVVLDLDASDMLRATAAETTVHDRPDLDAATPALPPVAPPSSATLDAVLAAWRSRELVVVIAQSPRPVGAGHERVYRMHIRQGEVTGEDVGDATAARKWADDLFANPGDRAAARALARIMVPPDSPDTAPLYVLATGSLGKVPLAALRDGDGSLIVARRPLVRVLALEARGPDSRAAGAAVVIADPRGDLPSASAEGAMVADVLGRQTRLLGPTLPHRATRARLWEARDAEVLHVAGHVGVRGRWRALLLADGDVEPAEIVRQHLAPRIAVLASCGSAAAMDQEGWGSIAAALLEAGTSVVIATDRDVRDDVARELMRRFYAQPDWRADPARALGRVQQALDAGAATSSDAVTKPRSWAAFSVLGRPPEAQPRGAR